MEIILILVVIVIAIAVIVQGGVNTNSNNFNHQQMSTGGDDQWSANANAGTNDKKATISMWCKRTHLSQGSAPRSHQDGRARGGGQRAAAATAARERGGDGEVGRVTVHLTSCRGRAEMGKRQADRSGGR